jgi:hypothetical protein
MEIKHRIELIKLLPKNPVTVELGVAEGNFSRDILEQWLPSIHFMVDLWETNHFFAGDAGSDQDWHNKNLEDVKRKIKPFENAVILRGSTTSMAQSVHDGSCDLVYVDACHSLECVRNDIRAWWPKLKVDGIMAFHDFENPDYGVNQAVFEFADTYNLTVNRIPEFKMEDAGAWIKK